MAKRARKAHKVAKPKAGERIMLGLRVTPEIKRRLDESAIASGRSQSQEAELRLEQSFREEDLLPSLLAAAYGPQCAALVLMIARAMHQAGTSAGFMKTFTLDGSVNWVEEPHAFKMARQAAERILDRATPLGNPVPPPAFKPLPEVGEQAAEWAALNESRRTYYGRGVADSVIDAALGDGISGDLKRWGDLVGSLLGDDLRQRFGLEARK